jgi:hypothetical protein
MLLGRVFLKPYNKMRRFVRCLLALLMLMTVGKVVAQQRMVDRASAYASQVLYGDVTRGGDVKLLYDSSLFGTRADAEPTFYVFTKSDGRGFAVISGDITIQPLLAYSTTSIMPCGAAMPPCFEGWLRYVDRAVTYARSLHDTSNNPNIKLWNEGYVPQNAIMLNTARWSQTEPYNQQCPLDDGVPSMTGCTQTAVAVIMHYYRWPERAYGVTEPYTTYTKSIDVPSRDLNHAYDWDNMLETYVEGEYNDVEARAVATLMADLGHSFSADYGAEATGAWPNHQALYENYGYSPASYIYVRNSYSDESWHDMLRRELEAGNPIWYSGYMEDNSGHAFVLDGIDENNYFHVNWGWGGYYDGFFEIDALHLGEYEFDYNQCAMIGLVPMRDGTIDNWLSMYSSGIETDAVEFVKGASFSINSIFMSNISVKDFVGQIRVGHCDKSGNRKAWLSDAVDFSVPSQYYGFVSDVKCEISEEVKEGDRLRAFYAAAGSDKWFEIRPYTDGAQWEVVMRYASIASTTSFDYDKSAGVIVVDYDNDVKSALYQSGAYVEDGVNIVRGKMTINTMRLSPGLQYTVLLVRDNVEEHTFTFTIKKMK